MDNPGEQAPMGAVTTLGVLSAAGGASGVIALLGAAVGYGRIVQRLEAVEKDVEKLGDMKSKVEVIEERTKTTNEMVREVKHSVDRLVGKMMEERNNGQGRPGLHP